LTYPIPGWLWGRQSNNWYFKRVLKTTNYIEALGKPIILCEGGLCHHPYNEDIIPMNEYPFTPEGKALWIRDHLRFASNHPAIKGFFYFYPDYFPQNDPTDQNLG
jgi:hypothetical protein